MDTGVFCTARCSRIQILFFGKTINQKRLAPDSLIYPVAATLPMVLLARCCSVKMSRITARSREVLILLLRLL